MPDLLAALPLILTPYKPAHPQQETRPVGDRADPYDEVGTTVQASVKAPGVLPWRMLVTWPNLSLRRQNHQVARRSIIGNKLAAKQVRRGRGANTRTALLAAGQRLLAERPIDALAIDEIVQMAGVAKGSFYNHFEDKDAFAFAIFHDIRVEIESAVARANEGVQDPASRVIRGLVVYVKYVLASHERASVLLRINVGIASADNPLNKGVLEDVAAGLRAGRFIVPSIAAGALFVIGACEIALMSAVENADDRTTLTLTQQIGALVLRGLGIGFAEAEMLSASALLLEPDY